MENYLEEGADLDEGKDFGFGGFLPFELLKARSDSNDGKQCRDCPTWRVIIWSWNTVGLTSKNINKLQNINAKKTCRYNWGLPIWDQLILIIHFIGKKALLNNSMHETALLRKTGYLLEINFMTRDIMRKIKLALIIDPFAGKRYSTSTVGRQNNKLFSWIILSWSTDLYLFYEAKPS